MLVMHIVGREPAWPRAHKVHRPRGISTKLICETEMPRLTYIDPPKVIATLLSQLCATDLFQIIEEMGANRSQP